MAMKVTLILLFLALVFKESLHNKVTGFKQKLKSFSEHAKETEMKLQGLSAGTNPVCVSSILSQVNAQAQVSVRREADKIALRFHRHTEYLDAIRKFASDRQLLTSRIHRQIRQDQYAARDVLKSYASIHGANEKYLKYWIKEEMCSKSGSMEIHKILIKLYKKMQRSAKLLKI